MSKEFIETRYGSTSIAVAAKQQEQLAYFTQSSLQDDVNESYIKAWAERKYQTNDYFLNHVKTLFKTDNFLSFFKYYRNPNAASKLIHNRIKEPLFRVFHAEDSYFNYSIRNKEVDNPKELNDSFNVELFESLLFRHNDIIIHDLKEANKPYRFFLDIDKVLSIEMDGREISKIAYAATVDNVKGYAYLDTLVYSFFDTDYNLITSNPHDLGRCPAQFVSDELVDNNPIVRRSMFTYLRSDFEEYVFLKTLQRMTDANGAIPVVTKLKTTERKADGMDKKALGQEPMSSVGMGNRAEVGSEVGAKGSVMQAGTVIDVPIVKDSNGTINMDVVKNLINFFYLPVEAMEYLNKRIQETEQNLIISILGDYSEADESAKNELQISKSYVLKEDKLRWLSGTMTVAKQASDFIMLALKYGPKSVMVDVFFGSDFFLETQEEIYRMLKDSPNQIESRSLLVRMAQARNRFNKNKSQRESILYKILPYAVEKDFKTAIDGNQVDPLTFQLQTRFNYWIAMFEARYGNILVFWNDTDSSDSEKLILINNLLTDLIKSNINLTTAQNGKEANSTLESV